MQFSGFSVQGNEEHVVLDAVCEFRIFFVIHILLVIYLFLSTWTSPVLD